MLFIWSFFQLFALAILFIYGRGANPPAPINKQNELKQLLQSGLGILVFF
jgi:hypothetical protein